MININQSLHHPLVSEASPVESQLSWKPPVLLGNFLRYTPLWNQLTELLPKRAFSDLLRMFMYAAFLRVIYPIIIKFKSGAK